MATTLFVVPKSMPMAGRMDAEEPEGCALKPAAPALASPWATVPAALALAVPADGATGMDTRKLAPLDAGSVPAVPFAIPGAVGEFRIQLLNEDAGRGVVTSVIHMPPGARIPAHRHSAGAEMHYVLEGDLVDAGQEFGPGSFLTHATGVVHGPHESRNGARVLTVQAWQSRGGDHDFEPAEANEATPNDAMPPQDGLHAVDERAQERARQEASEPKAKGYS
jgi:quercetin dioxygenase-like cupin family protein